MKTIKRATVDRDGNRYCGPLVLAALLGVSTAEAAEQVRRHSNHTGAVKGMHNHDLLKTLMANGFNPQPVELPMRYQGIRKPGETWENALEFTSGYSWTSWRTSTENDKWACKPGTRIECIIGRKDLEALDPDNRSSCHNRVKRVGPTLAGFLKMRPNRAATYVVNITGHYVLVSGRKFVDTYTRGEWVSIAKCPHRRARVVKVWELVGVKPR